MGVTRFESQVVNSTVGQPDLDKFAASFDKLSTSIENSGKKADKLAEHPGFESFAEKVKHGLEDPLGAAGAAAEGALKAMGPLGAGVVAAAGIFTAAGAVMRESAKALAEYGTEVHNLSLRTGLSTKEVSQFSFAAKAAGQDVGVFETAMRKLSQGLDDSSQEGKKARAGLAELGVSAYGLDGKLRPMADIFLQISDGLEHIEEPAKRNATALKIFGRAGIELIPTMMQLTENVARAKALGLGPSEESVARWEAYHKQLAEADVQWGRLVRKVKEPLAAVWSLTFRGVTGDFSEIANQAAAALKAEIAKVGPEEAQKRLDSLKQSGLMPATTIESLQTQINHNADKNLFAPQKQWQQTGLRVLGYEQQNGLNVDLSGFTRQIEAALGGTGDKGALDDANNKLGTLQDKLRSLAELKAPLTQQIEAADAVEAQRRVVLGIESRIEATKNLTEAEKALAAFTAQMRSRELDPGSKILSAADALIGEKKLNPKQASQAWQEAYLTASDAVGKAEEDVAAKRAALLAKAADDRQKDSDAAVASAGETAQRSIDIWIKTAEQVRQISTQVQINRAGNDTRQRMGFLSLAAGPGQEGQLANAELVERLALTARTYALARAEADTMSDTQQKRLAYARAYAELQDSTHQAENDHQMRVAQMMRQRVEMFRSEMGSLFDGLMGGAKGIQQFVLNEGRTLARAAFANTLTALHTGEPLTRNTVFGGTWLADPTKDIASTKLAAAGSGLNMAAAELMNAARALAMSGSGGGGGAAGTFQSIWHSIPRGGGGEIGPEGMAETWGLPTDGHPGDWAGEYSGAAGGGIPWSRVAGAGAAAAGGAVGIYAGVRRGGAAGALTASASAMAAGGAILSLVSKSLATWAGPAGMIAGVVLGSIVPSLIGDPKKERDQQESERLTAAGYNAPTATSYTRDRYGREFDYDAGGSLRPLIQINMPVSAIDSRDFADRAPVLVDMVVTALEDQHPRMSMAVRNTLRARG